MSQTKSMILAALFAALTAVGALIRIPTPISSFTLQVLFVAMSGVLLGRKWGFLSQAAYILLGLVGLPVFVSGGGFGALLQPTFGFLLGMAAMSYLVGYIVERRGAKAFTVLWACALGLIPLYAIGLPYMHLILTVYMKLGQSIWDTVWGGMMIFLPWDALKIAVTALLCAKLYPLLHRSAAVSPSL